MSYDIGYIINMEVDGEYQAVAEWCNEAQLATIEQQGDNFVVVAIPEPTEQELTQVRIVEIDRELDTLNLQYPYNRAFEEVTIANALGTQPSQMAIDNIKTLEVKKEALRKERANLSAKLEG